MIVKRAGTKIITKNGKVSCECCGDPPDPPFPPSIGCGIGCSGGGAILGVLCPITYYRAALYKAGGTWTYNFQGSLSGSADYVSSNHQRRTEISGSGSGTSVTSNNCGPIGGGSVEVDDEGGFYFLDSGEEIIPAGTGEIQGSFSVSLSETNTSPRTFCMNLNLVNEAILGQFFAGSGGDLSFEGCNINREPSSYLRFPYNFPPYYPSNIQSTFEFTSTLSFSPSAP